MQQEKLKTCSKCKAALPLCSFAPRRGARDGIRSQCKKCHTGAYYAANREKIKAKVKAWKHANRDRHRSLQTSWYEAHRKQISTQRRAYYEINREIILTRASNYCAQLSDAYVVAKIRAQFPIQICSDDIPQNLIETKRQHLMVRRLIEKRHQ